MPFSASTTVSGPKYCPFLTTIRSYNQPVGPLMTFLEVMTTQAPEVKPSETTRPISPTQIIVTTESTSTSPVTSPVTTTEAIYLSPEDLKKIPPGKHRLREIRKNVRRSRGLKAACRKQENKNKPVCRRYRLNLKRHRRSLTGLDLQIFGF